MGAREDVAAILLEMRRHGYRQLRVDGQGWLYGFKERRLRIPPALAEPTEATATWLRRAWDEERAEALGAYPGLKRHAAVARGASGDRPDTLALVPVVDIEQALGVVGGPP